MHDIKKSRELNFRNARIATRAAPYRSLFRQRVSRGLPAPGSKKCPKQSRNSLRSLKTVYFETPETVSRLFRTVFRPRGLPGDSLETLSGFRARRARETLVRGGRDCKPSISDGIEAMTHPQSYGPHSPPKSQQSLGSMLMWRSAYHCRKKTDIHAKLLNNSFYVITQ